MKIIYEKLKFKFNFLFLVKLYIYLYIKIEIEQINFVQVYWYFINIKKFYYSLCYILKGFYELKGKKIL